MIKMIATRNFPYQGKYLKKGDAFEARDKTHARQLRSASFAADAVKRGRPPKVVESAVEVAEVTSDAIGDVASRRKAKSENTKTADTYQTRDLIAD